MNKTQLTAQVMINIARIKQLQQKIEQLKNENRCIIAQVNLE